MNVRYVLMAARGLIADAARWTKWELARKSDGNGVDPLDDDAVKWCPVGALRRAAKGDAAIQASATYVLARHLPASAFGGLWYFNDRAGHCEIVRLFDEAIAALPAEDMPAGVTPNATRSGESSEELLPQAFAGAT